MLWFFPEHISFLIVSYSLQIILSLHFAFFKTSTKSCIFSHSLTSISGLLRFLHVHLGLFVYVCVCVFVCVCVCVYTRVTLMHVGLVLYVLS
jgi:hypothetical protein